MRPVMHKSLARFGVAIAAASALTLAACSGTSSFGSPQGGPVNPAPIGAPGVGALNGQQQAQGGRAVADSESVDAVAKWFFANQNKAGAIDEKFKRRLDARAKFDTAHPAVVAVASAAKELTLEVKGALPKDAPDGAIYALEVPTFPNDQAGAEQLAKPYGVQRDHQVVDPKSPDAPPQDIIKIAKGQATWMIDRLTGLVTFDKSHNDGVLPIDVKTAQAAAESFVRDHGGIPDDAQLAEPQFDLSKGDSTGAPKPRRITFVWHHKAKDIFGSDAISADVTMDASSGGGLPIVSAAPAPGAPGAQVAPAPVPAVVPQWGVTHMTRLWRTRGKEVDKASSLLAADAAIEKLKTAAIPGIEGTKPVTVSDVAFGEFRDPGTIVQTKTRPVWGMSVDGKHVDVDARTGEVLMAAPPPAPAPAPSPKGGKGSPKSAGSSAPSAPASAASSAGASPDTSASGSTSASASPSSAASAAPSPSASAPLKV